MTAAPEYLREAIELRDVWRQRTNGGRRVTPGLYSVRGLLLGEGETPLETPPTELRILSK